MSARIETHAFRIWAYARPRSWDCTIGEIAEALDLDRSIVSRVINARGWRSRLPDGRANNEGSAAFVMPVDAMMRSLIKA